MKLSKTSEYAIRILSFMGNDDKQLFSAAYLIEKLKISDKYLRKLMTMLKKNGLVRSIQGREGGYQLSKDTKLISVADIIDAVEGLDKYTGCVLGFETCSDTNPCGMHASWVGTREKLMKTLKTTSLANLTPVRKI